MTWLDLDGNAGFAPASASNVVNITFNPAGLAYGTYHATLLVQTGDASQPLITLPVSLVITPRATWRQTYFGTAQNSGYAADTADPDHDGIINLLEYAFNTDPNVPNANPISFAVVGNHLTLTFKRTHPAPADLVYTPQVANDLTSGIWNSGPAYTSQTVTDNGNGTETVVVTDNTRSVRLRPTSCEFRSFRSEPGNVPPWWCGAVAAATARFKYGHCSKRH